MKVELDFKTKCCVVTREKDDPKFYGTFRAAGESRLLYHVVQELKKQGHDVIKKRMWKDGHLVSDCQQYIRSRNRKCRPNFCIWNTSWQIRGAEDDWNREGSVILSLVSPFFLDEQQEMSCGQIRI